MPNLSQSVPESVSITLTFRIADRKKLITLADEAIKHNGGGVPMNLESPMAFRVLELLLHSNPDILSYADYGIELTSEILVDHLPTQA